MGSVVHTVHPVVSQDPMDAIRKLVADGAASAQPAKVEKPKITQTFDEFAESDSETSTVTLTPQYDADGRLHLIFPKTIPYASTRNTTRPGSRGIVCTLGDIPDGGLPVTLTHDGREITVNLTVSSTLNFRGNARKVRS